jgi:hypothetical protein
MRDGNWGISEYQKVLSNRASMRVQTDVRNVDIATSGYLVAAQARMMESVEYSSIPFYRS